MSDNAAPAQPAGPFRRVALYSVGTTGWEVWQVETQDSSGAVITVNGEVRRERGTRGWRAYHNVSLGKETDGSRPLYESRDDAVGGIVPSHLHQAYLERR